LVYENSNKAENDQLKKLFFPNIPWGGCIPPDLLVSGRYIEYKRKENYLNYRPCSERLFKKINKQSCYMRRV